MFLLENDNLPDVPRSIQSTGAPLFYARQMALDTEAAPLFKAAYADTVTTATIETQTQNQATLAALEGDAAPPKVIIANRKTYKPAANIDSAQPGEFVYNPYTQETTLRLGDRYQLQGATARVFYDAHQSGIPTHLVPPPYPAILMSLPIEGEISVTRIFEGQPSGQFVFQVKVADLDAVMQALRTGTEFDFYGMGMRINSLSVLEVPATQNPARVAVITANLGGKWENCLEEITWFEDLACDGLQLDRPFFTTVQALAKRAGATLVAPEMSVYIPRDIGSDDLVSWETEFTERVRLNRCFGFWSDGTAVRAKGIDAVKVWHYTEGQILGPVTTTIERDTRPGQPFVGTFNPPPINLNAALPTTPQALPAPVLRAEAPIGLFMEYTGSKLAGDLYFTPAEAQRAEQIQGIQDLNLPKKWKRRQILALTSTQGDSSPPYTTNPKHLSNNADMTGQTKTVVTTRTEDGQTMSELSEIYGYEIVGNQTPVWRVVEHRKTTHRYDGSTGYYLGSLTQGWKRLRFKTENPESPESVDAEGEELALYTYKTVPLQEAHSFVLAQFRDYYIGSNLAGQSMYRYCTPDGVRAITVPDPTYVEPMFVLQEYKESISHETAPNPNSTEENPLPDLISGQETRYRRTVVPYSTNSGPYFSSEGNYTAEELEQKREREFYTEYITEFSAQDAQYVNSLENTSVTHNLGRPSEAQRMPPRYREDKTPPEGDGPAPQKISSKYEGVYLRTLTMDLAQLGLRPNQALNWREDNQRFGGSSPHGLYRQGDVVLYGDQTYVYVDPMPSYHAPTNADRWQPITEIYDGRRKGSIGFGAAKTLDQAIAAAETDIRVKNALSGSTETIDVPFNPQLQEGDEFIYILNGIQRHRRILEVTHALQIQGMLGASRIISSKTTLKLGRDFGQIGVSVERKEHPAIQITLPPYYAGRKLGQIVSTGAVGRGA